MNLFRPVNGTKLITSTPGTRLVPLRKTCMPPKTEGGIAAKTQSRLPNISTRIRNPGLHHHPSLDSTSSGKSQQYARELMRRGTRTHRTTSQHDHPVISCLRDHWKPRPQGTAGIAQPIAKSPILDAAVELHAPRNQHQTSQPWPEYPPCS